MIASIIGALVVVVGVVDPHRAHANVAARGPFDALSSASDLTDNQRALAEYLNQLCGSSTSGLGANPRLLCGEVSNAGAMDVAARAAVAAVDPSALIGAASSALDLAVQQNQRVLRRIAAVRAGGRGVDFSNLVVQIGDQHLAGDALNAVSKPIVGRVVDGVLSGTDDADRFGVFANGAIRSGNSNDAHAMDLTTGIDFRLRDDLAIGASAAYSHDAAHGDAFHLTSWRGSLYGTYFTGDGLHIDALVSYGTVDVDSTRCVAASDVLGTGSKVAEATAGGRQLSGVLAGGVDWQLGPWAFGPHVGAYYLDTQIERLDESGAGSFDVGVGDQVAQSLRLNAGAQLGVALRLPWMVLTPRLDADYVQDLDDRNDTVDVHLVHQPLGDLIGSQDAALQPPRTDAGYFVWSVGASAQWTKLLSAFVSYRTYAGADTPTAKELTWGLRFEATP